jgi:hypothetical protein
MLRSPRPAPRDDVDPTEPGATGGPGPLDAPGAAPGAAPSLAGLGIAGVSRRRIAWAGLAIAAAWIVLGFAGQAVDAARATTRVAEERVLDATAAAETAALRDELRLVTQQRWVLQQARAYQLGSRKERPFAVAPGAPALPPDAPGSAARRLGAATAEPSPLEVWLEILFGPGS